MKRGWMRQQSMRSQKNMTQVKNRDASVTVKTDWVMIEEIDFTRFSKLSLPNVKEPEDLYVTFVKNTKKIIYEMLYKI